MIRKNPFPGMNPFFEQRWRDAHTRLIAYLHDALQEQLPEDLVAMAEEEVVSISAGQAAKTYRPNLKIEEPWTLKEPGSMGAPAAPLTESSPGPIRVMMEEEIERWLEIRDTTGRLITVLELLSPTNKLESSDRDRYLDKRRNFIRGGVNLVEIDLIRQGLSVFPIPVRNVLQQAGACYGVCIFQTTQPGEYSVYPIRLRDSLPTLHIPLRPADADAKVDLQSLIDQCHERGRYHLLNYRLDLDPPLPPEEASWVDHILKEHALR